MVFKNSHPEIVLIGAGIMSATLGVLLKELMPDAKITVFERMDRVGAESSDAWNNAGTGHAAYCELNYTPQDENGVIDISKALNIAEQFEISKQFWSYLIEKKYLDASEEFISHIDHMSFVKGDDNVAFLRKRYAMMSEYAIFDDMQYAEHFDTMREWFPLIIEQRNNSEYLAATRMPLGTDVNFGSLTRGMIKHLENHGCNIKLGYEVDKIIKKKKSGRWQLEVKDLINDDDLVIVADFVFIGAGGGSLTLLEKSDIPEAKGYGGFPVSGQWLKCNNERIIDSHHAKVYGKAAVGAPPMSVPHLDTRVINGKKALLFGPYAGFSTKFLKNGSYLDLFLSIEMHNVWPMLTAGAKNIPLTKYLVDQVRQSDEERLEALIDFYPMAKQEDWELVEAGQRVQVIKNEGNSGVLKFGTEVVTDSEGTIATLLGASPGASTSVSIMLDILDKCFPENIDAWQAKLKSMIPSFGISLNSDRTLLSSVRDCSSELLKLKKEVN
jgi:malate dehydrogenase (quinone)